MVRWLDAPGNRDMLPEFLRAQIEIGYQVSRKITSDLDMVKAARACIARESGWIQKYKELMQGRKAEAEQAGTSTNRVSVALAEAKFIHALWNRNFVGAARRLSQCLDNAYEISDNTGAWHSVWLGYAYELSGDEKSASELYRRAHAEQHNIPRMLKSEGAQVVDAVPEQVRRIEEQIETYGGRIKLPRELHPRLRHLNGDGTVNQTEDALRHLGQFMGFESTRPEKESETGPDVLWMTDQRVAICMEAKTQKNEGRFYTKDNIGQLRDHVQWVKDHTNATDIRPVFVGPLLPASESANPPHNVVVVELSAFEELGNKLIAALKDATSAALPVTLMSEIHSKLKDGGLLWPDFFESLPVETLRDIGRRR